jgi:hypothetical protein
MLLALAGLAISSAVVVVAQQPPPQGQGRRGARRTSGRPRRWPRRAHAQDRFSRGPTPATARAQHESVGHAMSVIEQLGYESGLWDTYIRTDSNIISKTPLKTDGSPASGGPNLTNVDAIFFMGHREVPIDDKQKADLLSFVKDDGKGFVAAHVGLTALESWPEFGELIGARFDGHPVSGPGKIINEDPTFACRRSTWPASFDSATSSTSRRRTRAAISTCCCAST